MPLKTLVQPSRRPRLPYVSLQAGRADGRLYFRQSSLLAKAIEARFCRCAWTRFNACGGIQKRKKSGKTLSCEACLRASVLQAASSHQPRLCQTGAIRATRRPGKHSPLNTEAAAAALGTRELKAAARWSKSRISCQPLARPKRARATAAAADADAISKAAPQ